MKLNDASHASPRGKRIADKYAQTQREAHVQAIRDYLAARSAHTAQFGSPDPDGSRATADTTVAETSAASTVSPTDGETTLYKRFTRGPIRRYFPVLNGQEFA